MEGDAPQKPALAMLMNASFASRASLSEESSVMIVVFDVGNVLLRWNPRYLYRKVFDDEARMERFLATALSPDFILQTDVNPDFSAAIEARAGAFPEFADKVRLYDSRR
jgi:hypothetical protein